ncbi:GNAT family N-acetyltransferase [Magnetospira sp. QH-2]|uniref:GNAT family N-acetyltransferase n=1 Tax=Magnetospira sp. (strain QH-2) TaxID=1288970 RepID=UPI0003E80BD3|nr:GNAT family N-acetyltransferase [Magnetospira sp. QH-2]CCQ74826.1 putative Acetyltransferase (GNAT) family protein [Magnetospira sp. QH-2]
MDRTHDTLETIERAALADLQGAGLHQTLIGGALVSMGGLDSSVVVNRTIGLGQASPATRRDVEAICAHYRDAGIGRWFVQVAPDAQPAALPQWLTDEDLKPMRRWMKFTHDGQSLPQAATDLAIREIDRDHAADFARIVNESFEMDAAAESGLAGLVGRPGWHIFMAFEGDTPAAAGALFIKDGVGWCDWGATDPAFRCRGAQSAILARRIKTAFENGCRLLGTCTGEDVPGDPQHSYRNIERSGFKAAYLRDNYAPY